MALAKEVRDLVGQRVHHLWTDGLNHQRPKSRVARQALHGARVGQEQHIILVAAPHVGSFCGKYPNDAKGSILHSDNLADRIIVTEQSFGGSLAN